MTCRSDRFNFTCSFRFITAVNQPRLLLEVFQPTPNPQISQGFTNRLLEDSFTSWHNSDMLPSDLMGGMAATGVLIFTRALNPEVSGYGIMSGFSTALALWFMAVSPNYYFL